MQDRETDTEVASVHERLRQIVSARIDFSVCSVSHMSIAANLHTASGYRAGGLPSLSKK